jgi:hypothetical protein
VTAALLAATAVVALAAPRPAAAAPTGTCLATKTIVDDMGRVKVICTRWSRGGAAPTAPPDGGDPGTGGEGGGGDDGCPPPEELPDDMACDVITVPGDDGPPPPPTPAEVGRMRRVELVALLHRPEPVTDPPVGTPSVLDVPTFVAVGNWQGRVEHRGCDDTGQVCVGLVAEPQLSFEPGEPGADTVECAGGGTQFDPGGGSPRAQADAPGACAHTYARRTGGAGRPATWPGQVHVTWDLSWTSAGGGGGSLGQLTLSNDVPRAVEEVQSVGRGG